MLNQKFPLKRVEEINKNPEYFRLLEKIPVTRENAEFPFKLNEQVGDEKIIVVIDTETTGLNYKTDKIIELGMVKISYSPSTMKISSIIDIISLYEDPNEEISEFITNLTGIDNEKVKDQIIDDRFVEDFLSDSDLIVAHNAKFDRPFFDKRFKNLSGLNWACSLVGVNWDKFGFQSGKLELLLLNLGWFYEGHRASIDCLALVWLFNILDEALSDLIESSNKQTIIVRAIGAPFEVKDSLKERGYRWNTGGDGFTKHWWTEVSEDDLKAEQEFLKNLYCHGDKSSRYSYIDSRIRFKQI